MLYSYNNQYPKPLPHRILLSNGNTLTDRESFTDEEIADAGYVAVPNPPDFEYPNKLSWDGVEWLVRAPNESEIDAQINSIRKECQRMLSNTDYKVIKAVELGLQLDPAISNYRQELRNLYNNIQDPWQVVWPSYTTDT